MKIPYYVKHHLKNLAESKCQEREVDLVFEYEYNAYLQRYHQGEPLSRILGKREFWSLDFNLSAETLDPRPDSETVIEAVLKYFPEKSASLKILDMGTGSGCLLLSLLHEYKAASGIGVDISENALFTARLNAQSLNLNERSSFINTSWGSGLNESFHIIISNPPYIRTDEFESLDNNVKQYDPYGALISGSTGLECYEALMPDARRLLDPKGIAFLEIGVDQTNSVIKIGQNSELNILEVRKDLAGIPRCLIFNHF